MDFSLYTIINNEVYYFSNNSRSGVTITNLSLDPTTGLTFDFSGTVYFEGTAATVTGKVDVTLNRTRPSNQVS